MSTTSAGSCTGSGAAHPRKPRPSTTLDSTPESTPVTRNQVCMKPGMLQCEVVVEPYHTVFVYAELLRQET